MSHSEKFQKLADEAKAKIQEISIDELNLLVLEQSPILVDVREDEEWEKAHAIGAIHLSRGTIEQKIEENKKFIQQYIENPKILLTDFGLLQNKNTITRTVQKLGYTQVKSLVGGFKAWQEAGLPTTDDLDSSIRS